MEIYTYQPVIGVGSLGCGCGQGPPSLGRQDSDGIQCPRPHRQVSGRHTRSGEERPCARPGTGRQAH